MKKLTSLSLKIVFLLIAVLILLNLIWLRTDITPPHWDSATHLNNVIDYLSFFKSGNLFRFIGRYAYYPPLTYWISSVFFLIFGVSADIGVFSLSIFLIILVFSAYLIGKDIKDEKLGFLFIVGLIGLPFLMSQTREYQLDFPLTSMILLNIYLFFKSNFLKIRSVALWFSFFSGLAFLTKWTYWPFFVFMIIFAIFSSLKRDRKMILGNIGLVFLVTYLVAGWWYVKNFTFLKADFLKNIQIAIGEKDPMIFSIRSLLFYPISLVKMHLRLFLSVLFIISLWIIKRVKNKKITFLLYLSAFYLIIMTFYMNKDSRFIEPITPLLVFVIAFALINIKDRLYRDIATAIFIVICLFNFTTVTFNLKDLPASMDISIMNHNIPVYRTLGYTVGPPKNQNWHVEEIINKYPTYQKMLVIFPEDKMFFNYANFGYFAKLKAPQMKIKTIIFNKKQPICSELQNYDVIVIDDNSVYSSALNNCCPQMGTFKLAEPSYLLPDLSRVWILKK